MKSQEKPIYQDFESHKEELKLDNDIFASDADRRGRPEFFMPPGTELLKVLEFIEIDLGPRTANKKDRSAMLFMSIFWNLIVVGITIAAFASGELIIILFMGIFMFAGFYLAMKSIASLVNRKKVVIDKGKLKITTRPIKMFTVDQELETRTISQLYVNKYSTGTVINDVPIMAYSLSAIVEDNKSVRIIDDSNLETVLYLEQEIERFLNIEDKPVSSEILK